MRWRLIVEEFSPKLICIKGSKNIVADNCSRLDKIDNRNDNKVKPIFDILVKYFA